MSAVGSWVQPLLRPQDPRWLHWLVRGRLSVTGVCVSDLVSYFDHKLWFVFSESPQMCTGRGQSGPPQPSPRFSVRILCIASHFPFLKISFLFPSALKSQIGFYPYLLLYMSFRNAWPQ